MATREQIEALKIDENIFELAEDTELILHHRRATQNSPAQIP